MNILVTGGSGFVGKELIALLLSRGHTVTNVDLVESHIDGITEIIHDLTTGPARIPSVDVCFHLASAAGGLLFNHQQQDIIEYNGAINTSVLSMILPNGMHQNWSNDQPKLIFVSSINVLENFDGDFRQPPEPISLYARSKWDGENYFRQKMPSCTIVRPTNIFGKSQIDRFSSYGSSHVIPDILHKIANSEGHVEVWGDGKQIRNFLHVRDLCEFLLSLPDKSDGKISAVCSSLTLSIDELTAQLLEFAQSDLPIKHDESYLQYEIFNIQGLVEHLTDIGTTNSVIEGLSR